MVLGCGGSGDGALRSQIIEEADRCDQNSSGSGMTWCTDPSLHPQVGREGPASEKRNERNRLPVGSVSCRSLRWCYHWCRFTNDDIMLLAGVTFEGHKLANQAYRLVFHV